MKAQGLSTEFDPTTAKSGGGGGAAAAGTIMSVPQSIDTSDLRTFLLQPLPRGKTMQCYIKRVKAGIKRMFPTYCLFLNEGDKFVLAGHLGGLGHTVPKAVGVRCNADHSRALSCALSRT